MDALPPGDWFFFDMSPLDRTGVPAWKAALFPHDPAAAGCEMQQGTGYGETPERAMIAATAECHEEIRARLGFARRRHVQGSYDELVAERGRGGVADPLELCLPAGSSVDRDAPLRWVEARRWFSGEPVLVPVDVAALTADHLPSDYHPFTTLITNGLGAGPSYQWAAAHGLLEILQRDGNGLLFRAMDAGVHLTFAEPLPPRLQATIDRVAGAGIRVLPKFATDEFGFANLFVVGAERDGREPPTPIMLTGCGEAAHPDRDQALAKAICEFAASRARKAFAHGPRALAERVAPPGYVERFMARSGAAAKSSDPRAFEAMADWTRAPASRLAGWLSGSVHAVRSHKPFGDLPAAPIADGSARARATIDAVTAAGMDILYVDMSPPGVDLACVKVIVPGLEVETMSYARIGERNTRKLLDRDLGLVGFGDAGGSRKPIRLTEEAIERLGGQPWFDVERAAELVGPLYPLYREPEAHHVAAAECEPA